MKRKGFTLVELLVVVAIIALLIGILLPAIGRARELANRAKCAANIRGIGQASIAYAGIYDGSMPKWQVGSASNVQGFVGALYDDSTDGDPGADGDTNTAANVSASLYLLVSGGDVSSDQFLCPSADDEKMDSVDFMYDFESENNISYSFINFFHDDLKKNWTNDRLSSAYAIGADENDELPSSAISDADSLTTTEKENWNSGNHNDDGQNVLYGDGHASFSTTPLAGADDDNIFAWNDGEATADFSEANLKTVQSGTKTTDGDATKDTAIVQNVMLPASTP
mgnify:CR=1 FL=1